MQSESRKDFVPAGNGEGFHAYVALPAKPNGHAVIVLQEIFGVTADIRNLADRYAAEGYLALAPDLFWRIQPGIELGHTKADIGQAFEYLARFNEDLAVEDIGRVADHVRALPGFSGRVVVLGLCLGGKLAYLAAAKLNLAAAVSFYGVGIEERLDLAGALRCPLMLHYGGRDRYAKPEAVDRVESMLSGDDRVVLCRYAEADHGFYTRTTGADAALAHGRTLAFLQESLGGRTS